MGCNQSKQEDIRKDNQQRTRTSPQAVNNNASSSSSTPSRPISSSLKDGSESGHIGESFTDKREMEQGHFFQDILDRTAQNFIDVSVNTIPPEKDTSKKVTDFNAVKIDHRLLESLKFGDIPSPSLSCSIALLHVPTVTKQTNDFVTTCSQSVSNALIRMHVKDAGDIVISFPEITV